MLKTPLTHPGILAALAAAGHGARILIADGHYPASTTRGPNAELVSLNLSRGLVSCTQVLECLTPTIAIEAAAVMQYATTGAHALQAEPAVWAEFRSLLVDSECRGELTQIERFAFYEAIAKPDVALIIATGDERVYGNLLLTIGVANA